jgi:transcription initiation factor IIF auxiliary subunit
MSLKLRNDWNYVGDDRWDWEVYLVGDKPKELAAVDYVKYILHPTFPNPIREIHDRSRGFRLKTNGWGSFEIKAFVYLKNGKKLDLKHNLTLYYDPPSGTSR